MPVPSQRPDEFPPLPTSALLLYVAAGAWVVVAAALGSRFWPDTADRNGEASAAIVVLLCLLPATLCWVGAAVVSALAQSRKPID